MVARAIRPVRVHPFGEVLVTGGVRVSATVLEEMGVVADAVPIPACRRGTVLARDAPFPTVRNTVGRPRVIGPKPVTGRRLPTEGAQPAAAVVPHALVQEEAQTTPDAPVAMGKSVLVRVVPTEETTLVIGVVGSAVAVGGEVAGGLVPAAEVVTAPEVPNGPAQAATKAPGEPSGPAAGGPMGLEVDTGGAVGPTSQAA